ncbi:MAG TPA: hypothetical protein VN655_17355 [Pseudolabrys sp.]|jgi:hypothetical protein|nr:hypothetical protein [Pseudolabrys sp.]
MSLIENERTKLLATALNNTAVATVVTAVIGPIAGFFYGLPTVSSRWWFLFWLLWLLVGIGLHLSAQSILGRLQE